MCMQTYSSSALSDQNQLPSARYEDENEELNSPDLPHVASLVKERVTAFSELSD